MEAAHRQVLHPADLVSAGQADYELEALEGYDGSAADTPTRAGPSPGQILTT